MSAASPPPHSGTSANVAYGFTIAGLDQTDALRVIGGPPEHTLHVRQSEMPFPGDDRRVLPDLAVLRHDQGATVVERASATMTIHGSLPLAESEIIHPFLWPGAALCAFWMGRETFHGGGFVDAHGGAWVVLGDSGDGKSSLLAALALAGCPILADDLVVADGARCFAGPRCIDLTPTTAEALGLLGRSNTVRWSHRERLSLPEVAASVPLHGFVHLSWSETITVEPVPPAERIQLLARHRRVLDLGVESVKLLGFGSAPALMLGRPRGWEHVDATCRRLLDETARRGAEIVGDR